MYARDGLLIALVLVAVPLVYGTPVIVSEEQALIAAICDSNVTEIILDHDVRLTTEAWQKLALPFVVDRNLTLRGAHRHEADRFLVLDLHYVNCRVKLDPGVTLTFARLDIRRARRGMMNKVDLVCESLGAAILMRGSVVAAPSCVPKVMLFDPRYQLPRPEGYGKGPQKLRELLAGECPAPFSAHCHRRNGALMLWVEDHAYTTPLSGTPGASEGGYVLQWVDSIYKCDDLLTIHCMKKHGLDGCVQLYYLEQQSRRATWYWVSAIFTALITLFLVHLWSMRLGGWPLPAAAAAAAAAGFEQRAGHPGTFSPSDISRPSLSLGGSDEAVVLQGVHLGRLVGVGSFGKVYQGSYKGEQVAVKVMSVSIRMWGRVVSEVDLALSMQHPNLLRSIGYFYPDEHRAAVLRQQQQQGTVAAPGSGTNPNWLKANIRRRHLGRGVEVSSGSAVGSGEGSSGGTQSTAVPSPGGPTSGLPGVGSGRGSASSSGGRGSGGAGRGSGSSNPDSDAVAGGGSVVEQQWEPSLVDTYLDVWLVTEYCKLGTLSQAIYEGMLGAEHSLLPDMRAVLLMALDIALGMAYLHDRQVLHGDLKCENVLLAEAPEGSGEEATAVVAKVADFGLSRSLSVGQTHLSTQSHGTVTHMAPELLSDGKLSRPSDVYSFGILMWELIISKQRPFDGMRSVEVIMRVVHNNERPVFPKTVPRQYKELAERCWQSDVAGRPTFEEVCELLRAMLNEADQDQSRFYETLCSSWGSTDEMEQGQGGLAWAHAGDAWLRARGEPSSNCHAWYLAGIMCGVMYAHCCQTLAPRIA